MALRACVLVSILAGAALAGCVTKTHNAAPGAGQRGLFRTSTYSGQAGGWYAPAAPPRYVKIGLASIQRDGGRRSFLARLFHRPTLQAGEPTAVIAQDAALPLPSIATVTDIQTNATIKVRVEARAPMSGRIISLSPAAARALGGEGKEALFVRVRYAAPVIAYQGRPALGDSLKRPRAETRLLASAASPPRPVAALQPQPQPQLQAAASMAAAAPAEPAQRPPVLRGRIAAMPAEPSLRVQAGAFASVRNAERAVAMLAPAGPAFIQSSPPGGAVLYRVSLAASSDRAAARALRARVAELGFADAMILPY